MEEIKTTTLNKSLVKQQGLTQKEFDLIEEKHEELDKIIDMINGLEWNEENKEQILQLSKRVELIEYSLQKLWLFPQDDKFHCHWMRIKHCSCPKRDNMERIGFGYYRRGDCNIHGEQALPEVWNKLKDNYNENRR